MIKIDIHKENDFEEWSWVKHVLEGLSFPTRFKQCILKWVQTSSVLNYM